MIREIIPTKDGSFTIAVPDLNATYHSIHGAIRESQHVYINSGLLYAFEHLTTSSFFSVFEMGFGTGLNTLLTLIEAEKIKQKVLYTAIELFPLPEEEIKALNYCQLLNRPDLMPLLNMLHTCEWENKINITPYFTLLKIKCSLLDFETDLQNHVIYFDAFAPSAQPELWTEEVFKKLYSFLFSQGILVTYCSKGDVRRNMIKTGFVIEKLPGPPGKREIIRSFK